MVSKKLSESSSMFEKQTPVSFRLTSFNRREFNLSTGVLWYTMAEFDSIISKPTNFNSCSYATIFVGTIDWSTDCTMLVFKKYYTIKE